MNGEVSDDPLVTAKWFARPANSWAIALAFVLTIIAVFLNIASATAIFEFCADSNMRSDPAWLLAVLSSPLALLLAITFPTWAWRIKRPLTLRRTLFWSALATLSIVGWPISFVAANAGLMKNFVTIPRC